MDERPFSELSEPEKLERMWHMLRGYVLAVARREGITPLEVLDRLRAESLSDEEWWAGLAEIDADVRASLADRPGTLDEEETNDGD